MRRILWAAMAALFIYAGNAAAQATRFNSSALRPSASISGATVRVCTETAGGTPCAPLASIFSDKALTVAQANPFTADSLGNFGFYAAGGCYKWQVSAPGFSTITETVCNSSISKINLADEFPGADAFAKINAAAAALSGGNNGTVDAHGFVSTTQTVTTPLSVPAGVTVLVDRATRFNVNVTGGVDAMKIANAGFLKCDGAGSTTGGFYLQSTANVNTMLTNADQTGAQEYFAVQGCFFQGHQSATVTTALFHLKKVFVNSFVRDNVFAVSPGITVKLENNSVLQWDNNWINGTSGITIAGTKPLTITDGGPYFFNGGAIEHAGTAQDMVAVTGTALDALRGVYFNGVYFEQASGANHGVVISDADSVHFNGVKFGGAGNANKDAIRITETVAGRTKNITATNVDNFGPFTNTVNDTIHSLVTIDTTVPSYVYNGTSYFSKLRWLGSTASFFGTFDHANTALRTYTFQDSSDTIVGRATTDTLTNKTLTSPALTTPALNGVVVSGTPTANQVLTATSATAANWQAAGGAGVTVADKSTTQVSVTNTTTETTLYSFSVSGGTLGTNNTLRFTANGVATTGATPPTMTLRVKYGATVAAVLNARASSASVTAKGWIVQAWLEADGATGNQILFVMFKDELSAIWGVLEIRTLSTVDSTVAQTLALTAQWGTAVAGSTITFEHASLEKIQ